MSDVFLFWLAAFMLVLASVDRPDRWDIYRWMVYALLPLSVLNGVLT